MFQMQRKPYLAGFFGVSNGRGNLNLLSKILSYKANIILYFWLEYQLEYRAKWHFT